MKALPRGHALGTSYASLYLSLQVACSGRVQAWYFHAIDAGVFFADIWRRESSTATLIGKNRIDVLEKSLNFVNAKVWEP